MKMADETTEDNVVNLDVEALFRQVENDVKKSSRESVKAKLKEKLVKRAELVKSIAIVDLEIAKIKNEIIAGVI